MGYNHHTSYKIHYNAIVYSCCLLQPTIDLSRLPYKYRGVFSLQIFGVSFLQLTSCNIGIHDLPDMYAHSPKARDQAMGIHIRQTMNAYVTTITGSILDLPKPVAYRLS